MIIKRVLVIDNYLHDQFQDVNRGKSLIKAIRLFNEKYRESNLFIEHHFLKHQGILVSSSDIELGNWDLDDFAGFILTGSRANLSDSYCENCKVGVHPNSNWDFRNEMLMIKKCLESSIPVLGICFGHQLIGATFKSKIITMKHREKGTKTVKVLPGFRLLNNDEEIKIKVNFNHGDQIEDGDILKHNFKVLGATDACEIQIIQHKTGPIFGVQFHPEGNDPNAKNLDGYNILHGFFKLLFPDPGEKGPDAHE
ncbi:MAG: type 1 glutamine amidotransferase [Promethearchaeota archaeon]